jgi:hypothetical protein
VSNTYGRGTRRVREAAGAKGQTWLLVGDHWSPQTSWRCPSSVAVLCCSARTSWWMISESREPLRPPRDQRRFEARLGG